MSFLTRLRRRLLGGSKRGRGRLVLYPDDVFLVSYPKSGNTWMRFLLANVLANGAEVDFHTVGRYVPAVKRLKRNPDSSFLRSPLRPRIIKSHAPRKPEYPRVIYLVRDGRDAYVSLYHHRLDRLPPTTTFLQFLQDERQLRGGWGRHVTSWLDSPPASFLLLRYEDLLKDADAGLRKAIAFAGLSVSDETVRRAVEQSSFSNMKRLEQERGRPRGKDKTVPFVRKGGAGGWRDYFGEEEMALFERRGEVEVLNRLGYDTGFSIPV